MATTRITSENVASLAHKVCIKKRELADPRIVDGLKTLLESSSNRFDTTQNKAILAARLRICEQASEMYVMLDEDKLGFEMLEEAELIQSILNYLEDGQ